MRVSKDIAKLQRRRQCPRVPLPGSHRRRSVCHGRTEGVRRIPLATSNAEHTATCRRTPVCPLGGSAASGPLLMSAKLGSCFFCSVERSLHRLDDGPLSDGWCLPPQGSSLHVAGCLPCCADSLRSVPFPLFIFYFCCLCLGRHTQKVTNRPCPGARSHASLQEFAGVGPRR